jgi:hypothetical protein
MRLSGSLPDVLRFAFALGYEDLNDHDELRHDPVMAVLAGKLKARRKRCAPVAGKSTLSRLEHAPEEGVAFAPPRYHKISHDARAIEELFVTLFLEAHSRPPKTCRGLRPPPIHWPSNHKGKIRTGQTRPWRRSSGMPTANTVLWTGHGAAFIYRRVESTTGAVTE